MSVLPLGGRVPRSIAINVGANTSLPGVRGPVFPDGSFTYVPIPEREPTADDVPTYGDLVPHLDLHGEFPADLHDRRVHLDPSFAEYPHCEATTYGDEHGVKAGPISTLAPGDYLLFYATLTTVGDPDRPWIAPEWGAYLVGGIELAEPPVTGEEWADLPPARREPYADNAHAKRESFDAAVMVRGDGPGLFDVAVPLSAPSGGADANRVVTELAGDSGRGPWWRRVLRFDDEATRELLGSRERPGDVV
jgi:hypothetical protein